MKQAQDLIDRSAEEGSRVVALALLSDADQAAQALGRRDDDEALHDFRVALRRLRSALRALRPWLAGTVRRTHEKRLKRLGRDTNAARDAEVQLAWLAAERETLAAGRRQAGFDLLTSRLEERRGQASGGHARLVARYHKAAERLRRRLGRYVVQLESVEHLAFAAVMGGLLSDQLEVVRTRLAAVRGASDEQRIHRARIEAKRLRYLLEALRPSGQVDPRPAVKHLKRLQDLLGELHDSHVLATEIADVLAEVSVERARWLVQDGPAGRALGRQALRDSPRPGLLAAERRLATRRDGLHAALEREWDSAGFEVLAADVLALVSALEARAGGQLVRLRRWLLSSFPSVLGDVPTRELDEGWLPGTRLRECVRRERGPDGERWSRALAQGAGPWRLAVEEET
ncbi:MAG TPA: CHAD domain-containing protein, partial [Anaeromyxobacteraceae bacterium]